MFGFHEGFAQGNYDKILFQIPIKNICISYNKAVRPMLNDRGFVLKIEFGNRGYWRFFRTSKRKKNVGVAKLVERTGL